MPARAVDRIVFKLKRSCIMESSLNLRIFFLRVIVTGGTEEIHLRLVTTVHLSKIFHPNLATLNTISPSPPGYKMPMIKVLKSDLIHQRLKTR